MTITFPYSICRTRSGFAANFDDFDNLIVEAGSILALGLAANDALIREVSPRLRSGAPIPAPSDIEGRNWVAIDLVPVRLN